MVSLSTETAFGRRWQINYSGSIATQDQLHDFDKNEQCIDSVSLGPRKYVMNLANAYKCFLN